MQSIHQSPEWSKRFGGMNSTILEGLNFKYVKMAQHMAKTLKFIFRQIKRSFEPLREPSEKVQLL